MPALKNKKQERFAIAVASGQSLTEAYVTAGYKANRGNASSLKAQESISNRIDEIMAVEATAVTNEIKAIVYDRELLLGYLQDARAMAIDKGNAVAVTGATVAMARILGLIIDRREVGDAGAFDAFTDEELVSAAAKKARELGIEGPHLVVDDDEEEPETPIKGVASTD